MFIQLSIFLFSVFGVIFFWLSGWNQTGFFLSGYAFFPTMLISFVLLLARIKDLFHPLALFSYILFISVPVKTIYLIAFSDDMSVQILNLGPYPIEVLQDGVTVFILSVFALCFGYFLGNQVVGSGREQQSAYHITERRFRQLAILSIIVSSLGVYLFLDATGAVQSILAGQIFAKRFTEANGETIIASFTYLRMIGQTLPQIVLTVGLFQRFRAKRNKTNFDTFLLLCLGVNSIAIPLFASSRLELAYLLIFMIMAFNYFYKMVRVRSLVIVGLAGLTILAVLGEVRKAQSAYVPAQVEFNYLSIFTETIGRPYFMDIGKTSAIVHAFPDDIPYLKGASFSKILIAPIPRSLWPEKPILAINRFIGEEVMLRNDESGVPPGFIAELYMNFGHLGVLFGVMFVGILLSYFYARLKSPIGNPTIFIFVVVLSVFTLFTVEILNYISGIFRYISLYIVFVLPFTSRRRAPYSL